jgi:hypothetical protein
MHVALNSVAAIYRGRSTEYIHKYSAHVSTGNSFQDLPRLRGTANNAKRYITRVKRDILVTYINPVKFN